MRPAKIILFTLVALTAAIVVLFGASLLFHASVAMLIKALNLDPNSSIADWALPALIFALVFLIPKNWLAWNKRYDCHGSVVIDAPISQVWDMVEIRERDDYFASALKQIRTVPGQSDEYHFLTDGPADEGMPAHVHIKIVDEVPNEYLAYYVVNADELPLFGKDHMMTEIILSEVEDGVKVTYIESLKRLTLVSFLAFLFLNPARDGLVNLKAQIEGTENTSILHRMARDTSNPGEITGETKRALNISSITAVVFTTGLLVALFAAINLLLRSS